MRDWRNRQTRTFKGRVRDRVSSSLTSRTKQENFCEAKVLFFCFGARRRRLQLRSNNVRRGLLSRAKRTPRAIGEYISHQKEALACGKRFFQLNPLTAE